MTSLKPYPSYRQTDLPWLGQIPAHWRLISLRRKLKDGNDGIKIGPFGSMLKSETIRDRGYKVFGQENVIYNDFQIGRKFIDDEKFKELEVYELFPGDIVITMMGTAGRCQVVPQNIQNGIMDSHLIRIRVADDVSPRFIALLIDEASYIEDQINLNGRGTVMQGLNSSIIKNLLVILPPLNEQNKILAYLDRQTAKIDALIAKKQRLLDLLAEQRAALINQAVTKGLNSNVQMKDSSVAWLDQVPHHWEVKRIKTLTPFVTSGSRWWAQYYSDEGALFIRIGNISNKTIDIDLQGVQFVTPPKGAEMERTRVRGGDVLISVTANIGSVGVVPENIDEAYVNQHIALTRPSKEKVNPRWMAYVLLSSFGEEQFQSLLYGGTKDGLGLDDVQNLKITLPPIEEQNDLVNYLDYRTRRLTSLATKIEVAIERLREYRAALISSLVTGKLMVDV